MAKKAPLKVDETASEEVSDESKGQTQREMISEYITRLKTIESEVETLKADKKTLDEEFKEKIDLKTLKQALKVHKILMDIDHQDTYESMLDQLIKEMGSL